MARLVMARERRCPSALLLAFVTATTLDADPITRRELLRRVSTSVLRVKHGLPAGAWNTMQLSVLLSINSVEPPAPVAGDVLTVAYTVTNFTLDKASGTVVGSFQLGELAGAKGSQPSPVELAPGESVSGTLRTAPVARVGPARIEVAFRWKCRPGPIEWPSGQPIRVCQTAAATATDVTIAPRIASTDADSDGIDDSLEDAMLARYRPYYRFSNDGGEEKMRPTDPIWYASRSSLLTNGDEDSTPVVSSDLLRTSATNIFTLTPDAGSSSLTIHPCRSGYYLNPANDYRSGFHEGDGMDWPAIVAAGGVGLFGHIARDPNEPGLYRIEYWQFYGYNLANATQVGDHEGDWEVVVVVVDSAAALTRPVAVYHYVHGRSIRFSSLVRATGPTGSIVTLLGANRAEAENDSLDLHDDASLARVQDSTLQLYCGDEDECTHPVVYVEWGAHASWPTDRWSYIAVPNHNGRGAYAYLAAVPPNLGEDWSPRLSTPGANIILRYNGHWGAFSRSLPGLVDQSPPLGPALHRLWARPRSGAPSLECLE